MRLSQAVSATSKLSVEFEGGAVLSVTYRPLSYTVREMDEARKDSENTDRIIDTMKRLLVDWDLTEDDDKTPIPLDHPLVEVTERRLTDGKLDTYDEVGTGKYRPADDDPLRDVPTNVFTSILAAVAKDQQPSPEVSRGSVAR